MSIRSDLADLPWMWGWEHTSVPVEWGAAAARLKSYGERHHRDDLTTAAVTTDAATADDFGFAGALVWGAHELLAAPAADHGIPRDRRGGARRGGARRVCCRTSCPCRDSSGPGPRRPMASRSPTRC